MAEDGVGNTDGEEADPYQDMAPSRKQKYDNFRINKGVFHREMFKLVQSLK